MTQTRTFGIVVLVLSAIVLWYISLGGVNSAPVLLFFSVLGSIGAAILGVLMLAGRA